MTFSLALHAAAQSASPIAPRTDASNVADEENIISAARARANARASGDAQTWAMFVDANFRDIEGSATATRKQNPYSTHHCNSGFYLLQIRPFARAGYLV